MTAPVRLGIVGVGHMGRLHLEKALQSPSAQVVGVWDTDPERQRALSQQGLPLMPSYEALLEACEAVLIASPTSTHFAYAEAALRAQRHVLIEKPVVSTPDQLEQLLRLQEEVGVIAAAAHVERFNPAFQAIFPYRSALQQYQFERIAPWTPRGSDVSVVLDLLIHDLDLFWALTEGRVADMRAVAYRRHTERADSVQLWIDLVDGRGASFLVSRNAPYKRRRITAHGATLWAEADLLSRQTTFYPSEGTSIPLPSEAPPTDALAAQLEYFLQCVQKGTPSFMSLAYVQPVMAWVWRVEALVEHKLVFAE